MSDAMNALIWVVVAILAVFGLGMAVTIVVALTRVIRDGGKK